MESGACYVNDIDTATELRLGLPGTEPEKLAGPATGRGSKRALPEDDDEFQSSAGGVESTGRRDECAPPAKAQIVGWPPIRSYRKNNFQAKKADQAEALGGGYLVKVSMDGAPYLRKIDLKVYSGYKELREALDAMFKCFSQGSGNMERCSMDYAITYEDKDGDWMLVGDVPWGMFASSCKRLRIMKRSEARGHGH